MDELHPDLRMRLRMPGLHDGENLRAERNYRDCGGWRFEMRMERLGDTTFWFEYAPRGHFLPIGTWPTLKAGQKAAESLRSGTHYWDGKDRVCRPYTAKTYAVLRGEAEEA